MSIRIATAPGSWGVEPPGHHTDPPWRLVLDEIAAAGFDGVELGPVGYLPEDPATLGAELDRRGLALAAGYVMEPFHRAGDRARVLDVARRTCRALAAGGARQVVLIEALVGVRAAAAGRRAAAPRLDRRAWAGLVATVEEVARVAVEEFGVEASFHPHAGTFVEFADELERLLADTDPELVGLCVDTGHAVYAGSDPVKLLRRHAGRVRYVHLKDVRGGALEPALERGASFEQAVAGGVFCPLGDGVVDFGAVRRALAQIGYDGWATYEQDRRAGDPRALPDAEASLRHLRRVGIGAERSPA